MSKESEERISEWVLWFEEHKKDGRSVPNSIKFLTKALEGCFELLIMSLKDIQELEGRKRIIDGNRILSPKHKRMIII